jgi:hypothetical protein
MRKIVVGLAIALDGVLEAPYRARYRLLILARKANRPRSDGVSALTGPRLPGHSVLKSRSGAGDEARTRDPHLGKPPGEKART